MPAAWSCAVPAGSPPLARQVGLAGTTTKRATLARPDCACRDESPGSWFAEARGLVHTLCADLNWSQKSAVVQALSRTFSLWQVGVFVKGAAARLSAALALPCVAVCLRARGVPYPGERLEAHRAASTAPAAGPARHGEDAHAAGPAARAGHRQQAATAKQPAAHCAHGSWGSHGAHPGGRGHQRCVRQPGGRPAGARGAGGAAGAARQGAPRAVAGLPGRASGGYRVGQAGRSGGMGWGEGGAGRLLPERVITSALRCTSRGCPSRSVSS